MPPTATKRTNARAERLREKGWRRASTPGWWVHPNLSHPWPERDAVRFQAEADRGAKKKAHQILKGKL